MTDKPDRISPDLLSAEAIDLAIGMNVRRIRKLRHLSMQALGNAVGLAPQQIQKYEHGHHRITCSMLKRIGSALQCSIADLYQSLPGFDEASDSVYPALLRAENLTIAQAIDRIPDQLLRQTVRDLVDALAAKPKPLSSARPNSKR